MRFRRTARCLLIVYTLLSSNYVFALDGPFNKNSASTIHELFTIPNSHVFQYSETSLKPLFFRGAEPQRSSDFQSLQNIGIQHILIFKLSRNNEVEIEKAKLEARGWPSTDVFHIPMPWNSQNNFESTCEMVKTALLILDQNYTAETATYVHCSVGEDRTSLLAALWKIWKSADSQLQISDARWVYEIYKNEMCRYGYGMGLERTNKPLEIVQKIEAGLTPLYVAIARELLDLKRRDDDLAMLSCSSLQPVHVNYKCEPNMNFQTNQPKGELYE